MKHDQKSDQGRAKNHCSKNRKGPVKNHGLTPCFAKSALEEYAFCSFSNLKGKKRKEKNHKVKAKALFSLFGYGVLFVPLFGGFENTKDWIGS